MIKIEYGVVAEGIKENFNVELLNCADISKPTDLEESGLSFKKYVNPCDDYSALLDGEGVVIPSNLDDENIGIWGSELSDLNGDFTNFPTVTLISDVSQTVEGLRLVFDENNDVFPTVLTISWYNGETEIESGDYYPTSSALVVSKSCENCTKIVIQFKKMNTPYSRLVFHSIDYGDFLTFSGANIKNVKIHQAINPTSTTLPTSSLDLTLTNLPDEYNFGTKQSLKVFHNGLLKGQFFIKSAVQKTKDKWNIKAYDYIDILEGVDFEGGIYDNVFADDILKNIFEKAGVPYRMSIDDVSISGYIPYTSCREALQQVLISIGAYAKTSESEFVEILPIDSTVIESIGFERVLQGQSVTVEPDTTAIEITSHNYTGKETDEVKTLYEAKTDIENLTVIFDEPMHSLAITSNGTIVKSGVNYAKISCSSGAVLSGKKYQHTSIVDTTVLDVKNKAGATKKSIKNATLVGVEKTSALSERIQTHALRNKSIKSRVIEADVPLVLGGYYTIETELFGNCTGILTEQTYSLFGGKKIAKDTVIK